MRGQRIGHGSDEDVLARHHVEDAYDPHPHVIEEDAHIDDLLRHLHEARTTTMPVVGRDGRLVGVLSLQELGRLATERATLGPLVIASDLASEVETVSRDETLLVALRRMGVSGAEALPVVEGEERRFLGLLTRTHVLALYERSIYGESASD